METNGDRRSDWESNHARIQSNYLTLFNELGRQPTLQEVADRCNISRNTVWRHCRELTLEHFRPSARLHAHKVITGLIAAGSKGDASAAKLYFQLVFGWGGKGEVSEKPESVEALTDDQIDQRLKDLLSEEELSAKVRRLLDGNGVCKFDGGKGQAEQVTQRTL